MLDVFICGFSTNMIFVRFVSSSSSSPAYLHICISLLSLSLTLSLSSSLSLSLFLSLSLSLLSLSLSPSFSKCQKRRNHLSPSHETCVKCQKLREAYDFKVPAATLSHEVRVKCQNHSKTGGILRLEVVEVAKVCTCRRNRQWTLPTCNCRRKRRGTVPKCVAVVENEGGRRQSVYCNCRQKPRCVVQSV